MDLVRETAGSLAVSEENHSKSLKSYMGREEMLIPSAEYNSLHWNFTTTQGLRSLQKAQAAHQQPQACRDLSCASPPQSIAQVVQHPLTVKVMY